MNSRLRFVSAAVLGIALAAISQTNSRFGGGPIGVGEIVTLVVLVLTAVAAQVEDGRYKIYRLEPPTALFGAILVFIITPTTFLSDALATPGVRFEDLIALYFCFFVMLGLPRAAALLTWFTGAFVVSAVAIVSFQLFVGGESAYYYSRFSGGAKNPNQLALYMATTAFITAFINNRKSQVAIISVSILYGLMSQSDAYKLFLLITVCSWAWLSFFSFSPTTNFVLLGALAALLSLFGLVDFDALGDYWDDSDEGGSRTHLAATAVSAWTESFASLIFGHGAGSFSGLYGPFEGAEAHNTALDLASSAGIFGLLLFPTLPLIIFLQLLRKRKRYSASVLLGFIAFSLFHFVGRQPVFWVVLLLAYRTTTATGINRAVARYA